MVSAPEGLEPFPPGTIVGWQEITVRLDCPEPGLTAEQRLDEGLAEAVGTVATGDKLAGWPDWVQGMEYPSCPECGQRLRLVLQPPLHVR